LDALPILLPPDRRPGSRLRRESAPDAGLPPCRAGSSGRAPPLAALATALGIGPGLALGACLEAPVYPHVLLRLLQYLLFDPLVDPPPVGFVIPARDVLEWQMHPEQIATPIRQPGLGKGTHQSLAEAGKGRGRR